MELLIIKFSDVYFGTISEVYVWCKHLVMTVLILTVLL